MRLAQTGRYKDRAIAVLAAVLLLNLITRFLYIRFDSIWGDESYAIWLAMHPIGSIIDIVKSGTDAPFYYLLLHFWIKLFGIGNDAVRTLSILLETGALFFFFRICQKTGGLLFAWCASLLVITSPLLLHYSLEVRAYPLVLLEVCLALYLVMHLGGKKKFQTGYWLALTVCNIIMLYTHFLAAIFLAVERAGLVLLNKKGERLVLAFAGSIFITLFAVSPWAGTILRNMPQSGKTWIAGAGLPEVLSTAYVFAGNPQRFYFLAGLILVLSIVFLFWPRTARMSYSWLHWGLFLAWAVLPVILDYAANEITPVFLARYILYASLGLFGLAAYMFSSIRGSTLLKASAALVLAVAWYATLPAHMDSLISENWQKAMPEIREAQSEGDLIMLCAAYQVSTFAYHYDKDIYKADQKIKDLLVEKKIYSVDNKDHVLLVLDREKPRDILLVQSQSGIVDPNNTVDSVLTSLYVKENKETMQGISLTRFHRR